MRRRVLTTVGVLTGAAVLSGCTALDLPLAAVAVDADGTPRALIRPCGDDGYRGLGLEGWPSSDEDETVTTGWAVAGERSGDSQFPLFSPPGAWEAERKGDKGGQRLLPGHSYRLGFGQYAGGDDHNGTVAFTAADISGLEPGQVWADDRAMSPGEFEELAEGAC
ncbi:hypothetical protein [Streptomyces adelaidensis]|jgi:hypothetical protein|uniref:hypothetical protein n=1 Tax=Streptomyces adelaidensis TaxID=2796465 RepID=UPI0019060338|nr:hypothetical protein [Streptomyces adelaidensis]